MEKSWGDYVMIGISVVGLSIPAPIFIWLNSVYYLSFTLSAYGSTRLILTSSGRCGPFPHLQTGMLSL